MYQNGSVITLKEAKTHGEGEEAMRLGANTCGMIVQIYKKSVDGNHEYVVDFGPYGQWYCYHYELQGQETVQEEGYDIDDTVLRDIASALQPATSRVDIDPDSEESFEKIDFEADLKKRMKEIESGSY